MATASATRSGSTRDVGDTAIPDPLTVRIDVHGEHVVVSPDPFVVCPDQEIRWEGRWPFTVRFDEATPLHSRTVLYADDEDEAPYSVSATVRSDAVRVDYYKYSVAAQGEDGRIHLLDPTGVVESDKTGKKT